MLNNFKRLHHVPHNRTYISYQISHYFNAINTEALDMHESTQLMTVTKQPFLIHVSEAIMQKNANMFAQFSSLGLPIQLQIA